MIKMEEAPKKILVDVYTDWCVWCDRMDSITFRDPDLAGYINQHFYAIRLDAELDEELIYQGNSYEYTEKGPKGHHELAAKLLKGRMSYPSVVFLDEEHKVIQSIVGFKTPNQFEPIATYFAQEHYKNVPWSLYQGTYRHTIIKE